MPRLDARSAPLYRRRLESITAESKPRFGSLKPDEMMAHLRRTFEMSLGEFDPPTIPMNPLMRFFVRWAFFDGPMPFPKGKVKAPESFTPVPEHDLETEREQLLTYMDRFIEAAEKEPNRKTKNAIFGPMPLSWWAKIGAKHMDHHLQQFGV